MADLLQKFASAVNITATLKSLANNAARECVAVDNGTNLYLDAMLTLAIKLAAGSPSNDKGVNVYFYSGDGTNYHDNATGADAAVTMRSPTNLFGPFVISTPTGGVSYSVVIPSVASFFGGIFPKKWGVVIENKSGLAFDSDEDVHKKSYIGVNETVE